MPVSQENKPPEVDVNTDEDAANESY